MTRAQGSDSDWIVEDADDIPVNPTTTPDIYELLDARMSRRGFLVRAAAGGAALALPRWADAKTTAKSPSTLTFEELAHGLDDKLHVSKGHRVQTLIRWGDPVLAGAPAFDPMAQSAEAQAKQFGYNCDYTAYLPLKGSGHGLLVVNHESASPWMMFPDSPIGEKQSEAQIATNMMAHGLSIVEVRLGSEGRWEVVEGSRYARRITPKTRMEVRGPAAGHLRLRTEGTPKGRTAFGTLANCAGGITPWGTVITAEENVHDFFLNVNAQSDETRNHTRMGMEVDPWDNAHWGRIDPRFDMAQAPRSPNHFGWMVEIDPHDPTSTPRKRTAMGRFKHEGCGLHVNRDGRVVAYMGDDQRFEYLYRFVTRGRCYPNHRSANLRLLDEGTLSVARFEADGNMRWLPLVHGQGPLTAKKGFHSQADVLIETRRAADLLGATKMDRPEDVEVNPKTGTVFVMLTNNSKRTEINAANTRIKNAYGQIVELKPPGADHAADTFAWDFLLMAGDPDDKAHGARYHPGISPSGWFASPDNCTFDPGGGRLWIATDGSSGFGFADGLWACDVTGPGRALTRHFLRVPIGAEVTGPTFTGDGTTLFCSIQHPGAARGATFSKPATRWPDFDPKMPPRPSVVTVRRDDGEAMG